MQRLLSPSQKAATALRRAERALRDWQDCPDAPHTDVDKMLAIVAELRLWVQGHVLSDIERVEDQMHHTSSPPLAVKYERD